jgi:ribosomal protein S18 acetylase RimI-like enzyme
MYTIRPVSTGDLPFLSDMLWEAAAVAEVMRQIGKAAALARPEVAKYLDGWGRAGDLGVIAVDEADRPLGAAWARLFPADQPGYGFIADDVPELSIGVSDAARGQGVGGALIDALVDAARDAGFPAVSLSVDRNNPALRLYERHGFRDAGVSDASDSSVTMVQALSTED